MFFEDLKNMISKIELKSMKFYSFHGVGEQEKKVGNNFTVDLLLTAPLDKAIYNDSLEDTINYATVYQLIKQEMSIPSELLEHVAGRILIVLKKTFPQLQKVELKISKLCPPFGGDVHSASVILIEDYL